MTGLDDAALLAVVAITSALGASALPRATWPRRSPAAAILLWQALGLASGLAAVGTLIGLALPTSDGGLVRSVLHAAALLRDGDVFGVAAMFGHARAHLRERHDLVLLPFTALRRAFPRSATCTDALRSVALLVEMLADDRALRGRPARELVSALVRFGTAGTCPAPAGALAAGEGEVAARVTRLLKPVRPLPAAALLAICLSAALLVAAPVTLLIV